MHICIKMDELDCLLICVHDTDCKCLQIHVLQWKFTHTHAELGHCSSYKDKYTLGTVRKQLCCWQTLEFSNTHLPGSSFPLFSFLFHPPPLISHSFFPLHISFLCFSPFIFVLFTPLAAGIKVANVVQLFPALFGCSPFISLLHSTSAALFNLPSIYLFCSPFSWLHILKNCAPIKLEPFSISISSTSPSLTNKQKELWVNTYTWMHTRIGINVWACAHKDKVDTNPLHPVRPGIFASFHFSPE